MNIETRLAFRLEEERINILRIVNFLTLISKILIFTFQNAYEAMSNSTEKEILIDIEVFN